MDNVDQLQARIAQRFPNAVKVGDRVVRFEKTADNVPYATYYFDGNESLPRNGRALKAYVDDLIGPNYFRGPKSLQWSNYLYFVTSREQLKSTEIVRAKKIIEADRRYARKFVISEEELDAVLSDPTPIRKTSQRSNVFSIWVDALAKAGIDSAILGDDDTPTRLAKIEHSIKPEPVQPPTIATQLAIPTFIQRIELVNYRPFPATREFDFGTVNLIVGSNATGKTSLLEAIELYYCGRNKRGGLRPNSYVLHVGLADGKTDVATGERELGEFRNRNLVWYGQAEIKTHSIDQSFARFNFLNADAAVNLSDSMTDLEDALSKLLIGPDASKTWHSMIRVKDALLGKVRELQRASTQIADELAELAKASAADTSVQEDSDVLRERLIQLLHAHGWTFADKREGEGSINELFSSLSEFAIVASQASSLGWIPSPITLLAMEHYRTGAETKIPLIENSCRSLDKIEDELRSSQAKLEQSRSVLSLLRSAKDFIDSGLIKSYDEQSALQSSLAQTSGIQLSFDVAAADLKLVEEANAGSASVETIQSLAVDWVERSEAEREAARLEYQNFSSLRENAFNLAQQLRQIANAILQQQAAQDICPLCHTAFGKGELAKHMAEGSHPDLETAAQALLSRVSDTELSADKSRRFSRFTNQLSEFLGRASVSKGVTIDQALRLVDTARENMKKAQIRLEQLQNEIKTIEDRGFTLEDFRAVVDQLGNHEIHVNTHPENVARQIEDYEGRIAAISRTLMESLEVRSALLVNTAAELTDAPNTDPRVFLKNYREQVVVTSKLAAELKDFFQRYPWPFDGSIAELGVSVNSVRSFVSELRSSLNDEAQRRELAKRTQDRKSFLESERTTLEAQLKPYSNALNVLDSLTQQHKLHDAMQVALDQNKEGIESIFLQIHAPNEFAGLGESFSTLRRKNGVQSQLTEISTGQRAAFALSIFLSQNAQLVNAPPVMLIDDPIAHIDDLNSLSFLDYLREIVIQGNRQIFFATANEKVASLFERKFDFLGSQFRRIQLSREL